MRYGKCGEFKTKNHVFPCKFLKLWSYKLTCLNPSAQFIGDTALTFGRISSLSPSLTKWKKHYSLFTFWVGNLFRPWNSFVFHQDPCFICFYIEDNKSSTNTSRRHMPRCITPISWIRAMPVSFPPFDGRHFSLDLAAYFSTANQGSSRQQGRVIGKKVL